MKKSFVALFSHHPHIAALAIICVTLLCFQFIQAVKPMFRDVKFGGIHTTWTFDVPVQKL